MCLHFTRNESVFVFAFDEGFKSACSRNPICLLFGTVVKPKTAEEEEGKKTKMENLFKETNGKCFIHSQSPHSKTRFKCVLHERTVNLQMLATVCFDEFR